MALHELAVWIQVSGSEEVGSMFFFLLKNVCVHLFQYLVGGWKVKVKIYIVFSGVWLIMWKWKWKC